MSEEKRYQGSVVWFDPRQGYGFISWKDESGAVQKDMFVHFSDIVVEGFKTLKKEQRVSFKVGSNFEGVPKAIEVSVLQ